MPNNPIIEKNGNGFVIRISTIGMFLTAIVSIITIIGAVMMPYKTFSDFANDSVNERRDIRVRALTADSLAKIGLKYSIENNYNMKNYFEMKQPINFKWKDYEDIKDQFYLK